MSQRVSNENDVKLWYGQIWHREPRQDEIEFHIEHSTPFSRLIKWLVDETPDELIGWHVPLPNENDKVVTAGYLDPAYKEYWGFNHYGIDYKMARGENMLCAGQGLIVKTGFDDGVKWDNRNPYGNYVLMQHNKHWRTLYGHMERIDVVPGWFVRTDYKIGTADNTGWSTGDHLHFSLYKKTWYKTWKSVNPNTKIT